jgi:WD40 repeat protein
MYALPTPPPTPPPFTPQELAGVQIGRFLILRKLGEGGMGCVYAAYDPELDRNVALKLIRAEHAGAESIVRFSREAKALAQLSHPNVVQIHDIGLHELGMYIAMEHVAGLTLHEWLARERPWTEVLDVLIQAGRGLAAAHAAQLVHRDFKPGNVMVGDDGRVRVLDFGLVRRVDAPQESLTQAGSQPGTPAYMAPEQLEQREVGPLTDQFTFCMVAFEALHRRSPHGPGPTLARATRMMMGVIVPRPRDSEVPRRIHAAIVRGLALEPSARWPSLDALLTELELCRARGRHVRYAAGGLMALVALVGGGMAWNERLEHLATQRVMTGTLERKNHELELQMANVEALRCSERARTPGSRFRALVDAVRLDEADRLRMLYLAARLGRHIPMPDLAPCIFAATFGLRDVRQLPTQPGIPLVDLGFDGLTGELVTLDQSQMTTWTLDARPRSTAHCAGPCRALEPRPHSSDRLTLANDRSATLTFTRSHQQRRYENVLLARWSAEGDRLALLHEGGRLAVLGVSDHEATLLHELSIDDEIHALSFTGDQRGIVALGRETGLRVWSLESGQLVASDSSFRPALATFSPDGSRVAIADRLGGIQAWDLDDWSLLSTLHGHRLPVTDLAFSPDGRRLVSAGSDGLLIDWEVDTGRMIDTLEGPSRIYMRLQMSGSGKHLACIDAAGRGHVWTLAPTTEVEHVRARGHEVMAMAMFDDLVLMGEHERAVLYRGNRVVTELPHPGTTVRAVTIGRAELATLDKRGDVRLWSLELAGQPSFVKLHVDHAISLDLAASGVLAVGNREGLVQVWERAPGQPLDTMPSLVTDAADTLVAAIDLDETGTRLAMSRVDEVAVWDVRGRASLFEPEFEGAALAVALGHEGRTLAVTGSNLRVAGQAVDVAIWDVETGVRLPGLPADGDQLGTALALSPTGALAVGHQQLRLGWPESGQRVVPLSMHRAALLMVAFSRDGEWLYSGSADGQVIRSLASAEQRLALACELRGHEPDLVPLCSGVTPGPS